MPKSFRGYDLVEKLGSGGMSTIYLGIQTALDRKVVVKMLHPSLAEDAGFIARFEREARAASSLGHNNIVTVIDFGSEDDVYYIIMEYIEGVDLAGVLRLVAPWPPEIALAVLQEIAYGLEAAHAKGVIHRDMKPGNVLLSSEGDVKIVDFGLARQRSDLERLSSITMPGIVLGTPAYMSPEQAVGDDTDHRTDIFSLGCVAYEVFTGKKAFSGTSHSEVRGKLIGEDAAPMRRHSPLVNDQMEVLIARMMAKDRDKRFASMTDVLASIEETMEGLESPVSIFKMRRRYLTEFSRDPAGFTKELNGKHVAFRLDRGSHLRTLGLDKIDDALQEYRVALALDPANRKAKTAIRELENSRQSDPTDPTGEGTTVSLEVTSAMPAARHEARHGAAASWWRDLRLLGAFGVVLMVVALGWMLRGSSGSSASATLRVTTTPPGARVSIRGPEAARFRATPHVTDCEIDGLVAGNWDIRLEAAGREAKEFSIELAAGHQRDVHFDLVVMAEPLLVPEPPSASITDSSATAVVQSPPPTATETKTPPRTQTPAPRRTPPAERQAEVTERRETPPPAPPEPAAAAPRRGTLIVLVRPYADFYLDGRLVERQERRVELSIAAGAHRLELRHPTFGVHLWDDVAVAGGDTLVLRHQFRR